MEHETLQFVDQLESIFSKPELGNFVLRMEITEDGLVGDDNDNWVFSESLNPWPANIKYNNWECFVTTCEAELLKAGILANSDDEKLHVSPPTILLAMLPLLHNVHKLQVKAKPWCGEILSGFIRSQMLQYKVVQARFPDAFKRLTHLDIRCCGDATASLHVSHLLPFIALPALKSIAASGIISSATSSVSQEAQTFAAQLHHKPALDTLLFDHSEVMYDDLDTILDFLQQSSLRKFELNQQVLEESSLHEEDLRYEPRQLIRMLRIHAAESLETLKITTSDAVILSELSLCNFAKRPREYLADQLAKLSVEKWSLNEFISMSAFRNLKHLTIEAHLLLRGYGVFQRLQAGTQVDYDNDPIPLNGLDAIFLSYNGMNVREPWPPLPLHVLLPTSLETLEIICSELQRSVMFGSLQHLFRDAMPKQRPNGFPHLRWIKLRIEDFSKSYFDCDTEEELFDVDEENDEAMENAYCYRVEKAWSFIVWRYHEEKGSKPITAYFHPLSK